MRYTLEVEAIQQDRQNSLEIVELFRSVWGHANTSAGPQTGGFHHQRYLTGGAEKIVCEGQWVAKVLDRVYVFDDSEFRCMFVAAQ